MLFYAAVLVLVSSACGQKDELNDLAQNVPGIPGEDYPIFSLPPETSFDCDSQIPGYYADTEADCQMYHICAGPENSLVKYDFLCPNGTLFDQQYFVCNWWFNVDCSLAKNFYSLNADVLAAMEAATDKTDGRKKKSVAVTPVEVVSNVDRESLLGADEKVDSVDL